MSPVNAHGQPVGEPLPSWQPRPRPVPTTLVGRTVRLEPLGAVHAEALYDAACRPGDDVLWTYLYDDMPPDPAALRERLARRASATEAAAHAIIPSGEGACGYASLMRIDADNGVVEVGNILYGRPLQRAVAATEAMWLLMRHVFDDLGYRRYEWKLDSLNLPSAAAARRLGFTYEGRFRQAVVYKGRNRDTDWFAMTDVDFQRLRPAYDAWLDPANFDAAGRQRRSLSSLTAPSPPVPG